MRVSALLASSVIVAAPSPVLAKGEGVGVYLQGLVSNVRSTETGVTFKLSGVVELVQYRGQERSVIRVTGAAPVPVTAKQSDFCFVMIDDSSWNPGPCREGQLIGSLERAAREHRAIRLELARTTLRFGDGVQEVEVQASEMLRLSAPSASRSSPH
ncbi:MAG TPA: hypothetical protein VML91_22690 [Burkholderiales bacterium]|nr:hypothetical protein [Burkholderiales bacterium]